MSDLISREETIEEIESVWNSISGLHPHLDDTMALYADIKRIVKKLQPAYPKKGKWIGKSTGGTPFYCCSECGCVEWDTLTNYCPDCGARMDKDESPHGYTIDSDLSKYIHLTEGEEPEEE